MMNLESFQLFFNEKVGDL